MGDTLSVRVCADNRYFDSKGVSPFLLWGQFRENPHLTRVFAPFPSLFGVNIISGALGILYSSVFHDSANGSRKPFGIIAHD
jgi:hypothetical protein